MTTAKSRQTQLSPLIMGLFLLLLSAGSAAADDQSQAQLAAADPGLSAEERERELARLLDIVNTARAPIKDADLALQLDAHPEIGRADAELVIVEFSDFQCPHCRRHLVQTMPRVVSELVDTGKVRYVFFDYPIEAAHPFARKAAQAARCADEQGQYWAMRQHLFQNAKALQPIFLKDHADAVGLDVAAFDACMGADRLSDAIANDQAQAIALSIRGTPTLLVGTASDDGKRIQVIKRIDGAVDYPAIAQVVDQLLADAR
jgi:protein-disulfide isomerase